jgi:putative oxidoreductase
MRRFGQFLQRQAELFYAALRMATGVLFLFHGLQKIFGILATRQPEILSQRWIGGVIEIVCGGLVALGLATRPAAFLASGMMAVAYVQFHWKGAFDASFGPIVNRGELALLYAFLFLYIAAKGGGRGSLDSRR